MTHAVTRARYYRNNKHKWDTYREANRERILEQKRNHYANNKEAIWANDLFKKYGLTVARYNEMLLAQGFLCAICERPERAIDNRTKKPRRLCVDHHHGSNRVRKLLCMSCNRALGLFQDDPELLIEAANYIRSFL